MRRVGKERVIQERLLPTFHGVVSLDSTGSITAMVARFRQAMNLLPFAMGVSDGEVFWILEVRPEPDGAGVSGSYVVSAPVRFNGERVTLAPNQMLKALYGIWPGTVWSCEKMRAGDIGDYKLSVLSGDISPEPILSDNFHRFPPLMAQPAA